MNQITYCKTLQKSESPIVWTALITPLLSDGAIDYVGLQAIAEQQNAAANGILLLGSTGEGLALTNEEQLAIVEFVVALSLDVPLMVAVGGHNLAAQLDWIGQCNQLPISAYLLGSPIYAKPGPIGQTAWYQALLDAADFPCMLYNVPSRSGVEIAISALQALQHHENCWALKEASGDLNKLLAYRQHCPDIELFSGEDAMMPYLANAGVRGLVSVCANVWPQETQRYVALALSQQCDDLFPLWHNAIAALFQVTSPIPVKVLMTELAVISTATLRLPLCQEELASDHNLHTIHQKIQQWAANQSLKSNGEASFAFEPALNNPQSAPLSTSNLREVNQ
jgi:4-hydroxy-tetrahydrodipicolinate synthase